MSPREQKPIFVAWEARRQITWFQIEAYELQDNDALIPKTAPDGINREIWVSETWVESRLTKDWICAYRLLIDDSGQPHVGEIRLFPYEKQGRRNPPGDEKQDPHNSPGEWSARFLGNKAEAPTGGITADLIRKIKIKEPQTVMAKFLEWVAGEHPHLFESNFLIDRNILAPPETGRRKRIADEFYAEAAKLYSEAIKLGKRKPVMFVQKKMGISEGKAKRSVYEARRRKLLTPAPKTGSSGGQLTPKARRILGLDKGTNTTKRKPSS